MLALSLRQLDDSRFSLSVPPGSTISAAKQALCRELGDSTSPSSLVFVFSGRVCPESAKLQDYLPSVTQGLTVLKQDGSLIRVPEALASSKAASIVDFSEEFGKRLSPLSQAASMVTDEISMGAPRSSLKLDSSPRLQDVFDDATAAAKYCVEPPPPASSWSPQAITTVTIADVLGNECRIDLSGTIESNGDVTLGEFRRLVQQTTGNPLTCQRLYCNRQVIPTEWNSCSIRCLGNAGARIFLTFEPSTLLTESPIPTAVFHRIRTSSQESDKAGSAGPSKPLQDALGGTVVLAEATESSAQFCKPFSLDDTFGNDAHSRRLRSHCYACNTAGAHFEPRALCPVCEEDHEGIVVETGRFPAPSLAVHPSHVAVHAPAGSCKWRDIASVTIRCLRCEYNGPARIGFMCRSVTLNGVRYLSDADAPRDQLIALTSKLVLCPSRLPSSPAWSRATIASGSSGVVLDTLRHTAVIGDDEDPMIPVHGVSRRALISCKGDVSASVAEQLRASVARVLCGPPLL